MLQRTRSSIGVNIENILLSIDGNFSLNDNKQDKTR